jgi:hypothetical protein
MERFETKFHPHQIQHPHHNTSRRLSLGPGGPGFSRERRPSSATASTTSSDFHPPLPTQRRASGLTLLYKPNKPDIDLVRDFKQSLNAPQLNPLSQGRKYSSPCIPALSSTSSSLFVAGSGGNEANQRRRNSSFTPLQTSSSNNNAVRPDLDL